MTWPFLLLLRPSALRGYAQRLVRRPVSVLRSVFGHLEQVSVLTRNSSVSRKPQTREHVFSQIGFVFRKPAVGWGSARMCASRTRAIVPLGWLALGA